jgi:hypothetical protein
MALGQNKYTSGPMGFKLVKGSAHDCEPAPFSDPIHNSLQVTGLGYPNTFNVANEVAILRHVLLRVGYFICHKTHRKYDEEKSEKLTAKGLVLNVLRLYEV